MPPIVVSDFTEHYGQYIRLSWESNGMCGHVWTVLFKLPTVT